METGIGFEHAFSNTCQCSASRVCPRTGALPSEHVVTNTFRSGRSPQTLTKKSGASAEQGPGRT